MSFYDDNILPHLIHFACSTPPIMKLRKEVVPGAEGRVLEVGMGTGLNLPLYRERQVEWVWGLEPSEAMRRRAKPNVDSAHVQVNWLDLPGEEIPLPDNSVDTVLLTFTLCTIPDWRAALAQMHRVLKPSGRLLFCEHGRSADAKISAWQDRLTPTWKAIAGGCHLNRPIQEYLEEANFSVQSIHRFYLEKTPRFMGHIYLGEARKSLDF